MMSDIQTTPTDEHPWLRFVRADPDNFYDVQTSDNRRLCCVQLHALGGLLIASFEDSEFITALSPDHVVSIAVSPESWKDEN